MKNKLTETRLDTLVQVFETFLYPCLVKVISDNLLVLLLLFPHRCSVPEKESKNRHRNN